MDAPHLHGLYAVTPETLDDAWLAERVEQALRGGARAVQYRSKHADAQLRRRQAQRLLQACRAHGALFVVNDDVDLALELEADGVHLGRDDLSVAAARARLRRGALIGASCYDDLARAERAAQDGADYLAFGSLFPSAVKPGAVRASLELLRQARGRWRLPLVAIGGIEPDNAARVIQAGADAVAVITALFSVPDTLAAARALSRLFQQPTMPAL
jgi:thiamine-phosphate pyrophosphorylase